MILRQLVAKVSLHYIILGLYNPTIRNIINLLHYTDILRSKWTNSIETFRFE